MSDYTTREVVDNLSTTNVGQSLPPRYVYREDSPRMFLAVESMQRHMTDEGWQIADGLARGGGYLLAGYGLQIDETNVKTLVNSFDPSVVVLQDKREWDVKKGDFREPLARFHHVSYLAEHDDIFRLTILKDSHQNPTYHRESANEIGCHAWIIYYHPRIVSHLASYVRPQHLIRTYHSVDFDLVPTYTWENRSGALLSGAVSGAYPLRQRLVDELEKLPNTIYLKHPGYHKSGCCTPGFLRELTKYRVAICTSSRYGYALRKIIEATACGCRVLTDLPVDEVLPEIDDNLVRIRPDTSIQDIAEKLRWMDETYKAKTQLYYACKARWYDFREVGKRLAQDIDSLRRDY